MIKREKSVPKVGFIFRNKENPDSFSYELYIEVGLNVEDYYDEVPLSVYEEHQKQEKMMIEVGEINGGT